VDCWGNGCGDVLTDEYHPMNLTWIISELLEPDKKRFLNHWEIMFIESLLRKATHREYVVSKKEYKIFKEIFRKMMDGLTRGKK